MRAVVVLPVLVVVVAVAACGDDDTGSPGADAALPVVDAGPPADADVNRYLSQVGLYTDIATKTVAPDLLEFTPRYKLWSDGADKLRWVRLPAGEVVDTSDMEHWRFPVGTQFYKEFRAPDGRRLETRLIERLGDTGNDEADYWFGAFVWREDESDAVFIEAGMDDVRGTDHDVPSATRCRTCHVGEAGHGLGFSALQLAGVGPPGVRLADLEADGRLSVAPASEYVVPGDAVTQAALGYLHANCGHCHNPHGSARPDVDLTLQLGLAAQTPEETTIWQNTVDVPLFRFMSPGVAVRVSPGDAAHSGIIVRMSQRGAGQQQMPPIATEFVDDDGLAAVTGWIDGMAP